MNYYTMINSVQEISKIGNPQKQEDKVYDGIVEGTVQKEEKSSTL